MCSIKLIVLCVQFYETHRKPKSSQPIDRNCILNNLTLLRNIHRQTFYNVVQMNKTFFLTQSSDMVIKVYVTRTFVVTKVTLVA